MKYTEASFVGLNRVGQLGALDDIMADRTLSSAQRKSALQTLEKLVDSAEYGRAAARRLAGTADMVSAPSVHNKSVGRGNTVAPLTFDRDSVDALHKAVLSRQSLSIKSFSSANSLLPPQLLPDIVGPVHEVRLLDRLPTITIQAPSFEYIRHTSTTGAAAVTAEGASKPELVFAVDAVIAPMVKLAAHAGISYEALTDHGAFVSYLQTELMRQVVDAENTELLNGPGTTGRMTGLLSTSGILVRAVGSDTPLDAVEAGIAAMRVGAALAEPDLLVLHPATWSALRRVKDSQNRYLVSVDPTAEAAQQLWGVPVLPTTTIAPGVGLLVDSAKFGRVIVRETLTIQTGTSADDFVRNLQRFVCETRLGLAVERPAALLKVTGLPTS